jgi:hypothetical protein
MLEEMTHDPSTEIEDKMKTTTKAAAQPGNLDTLLTKLGESYDEEIARIERAIDRVDRKKREISDAAADTSQVPFESIVRVKQREADELAARREPEAARAKLQEAEEIKAVPRLLEESWSDCTQEKSTLQNDQRNAARKVLDEWMPSAVQLVRAEERKLFALLDRIAAEITEFIDLTGNTSVPGRVRGIDGEPYIDSLVAGDGEEGEARKKWYTVTETLYIRGR